MKTMFRSLSRHSCQPRTDPRHDGAYTSIFSTASWPLGVPRCALNVSRRLTGRREEPGILTLCSHCVVTVVDAGGHGKGEEVY